MDSTRQTALPPQKDDSPPRSPAELSSPDWKESARRAAKEFKTDKATLVSAGMAFYWFLAVFPAVIAAVGILGLVNAGPKAVADIQKAISTTLPGDAAKVLGSAVGNAANASGGSSLIATAIGLVLALSSASAGMVALQRGMDVAYDVTEERKLVAARLRALVLIAITAILGGVATTLIVFGKPLGSGIGNHLPLGTGSAFVVVWTVLRWGLGLAALSMLFASFYTFGPNRDSPRFSWVSPGGILAMVVWLLASVGFSFYVSSLGDYNKNYGSLSGVVVLLLWLYLSAIAVVAGAELNAELERQGERRGRTGRGGRGPRGGHNKAQASTPHAGADRAPSSVVVSARAQPGDGPASEGQQAAGPSPRSTQDAWLSYGRSEPPEPNGSVTGGS
ncbi:MAG: YihY/virulence factor BrkB family protein [Acidimicrobiales bacterium]